MTFTTKSDADIWDPNNWDLSEPEYRIYNAKLDRWAVVDYIDYQWAVQRLWYCKRNVKQRKTPMYYFCRSGGGGGAGRRNYSEYLHIEIMKRTGVPPPSELHTLVDHDDRDTMNCRRSNLKWATIIMNRANRAKP